MIFSPRLLISLPFELHFKVIEQKYVDFLMGPGGKQCEMHSEWATLQWENPWKTRSGQSLAAINHAAGVNVILDQTHKFSGYSHAKIFGSEEMQPRHFQHGTVKCLVHFEALNFGGQSEKCQVGHRLQVVTMASTP